MNRSRAVGLDLFPQPMHMNVNGSTATGEVVSPDLLEKLIATEDVARIASEEQQEIELFGLEGHCGPIASQLTTRRIDHVPAELDRPGLGSFRPHLGPPERGLRRVLN